MIVRTALFPGRAAWTIAVLGETLILLNTLKAMEPLATDVITTHGALEVAVNGPGARVAGKRRGPGGIVAPG